MLTRADLWLLVIGALITGAVVTLAVLPGYIADLRRWSEPIEKPDLRTPEQRLGAAVRRRA